jgi:hypothetical protein
VRPDAICLGIAGVDRPQDTAAVHSIMRRIGFKARVIVVNRRASRAGGRRRQRGRCRGRRGDRIDCLRTRLVRPRRARWRLGIPARR